MLKILRPIFCFSYHPNLQTNYLSTARMSKKALVLIAPGSEDMEAVITIDVLRRGGVEVTVAGVDTSDIVKCSNGVNIKPDVSLSAAESGSFDAIVLPGGLGGSKTFATSPLVGKLLNKYASENKVVAAICAAPTALKAHGVLLGKNATCYPSMADEIKDSYKYHEDKVVVDDNLITSRGPGTAFDFGLALVTKLVGEAKTDQIAKGMLLK